MVILYGHISKVECLPAATALEDVWLALDMIPRFRWRWERKDVNGGHPLIAKLAEHIMGVRPHDIVPPNNSILFPELDWDETKSPSIKSLHTTPTMSSTGYNSSGIFGPHPRSSFNSMNVMSRSNSGGSTPVKQLADMPDKLFYPFFPEAQVSTIPAAISSDPAVSVPTTSNGGDTSQLLKAVAAAQDGYGGQSYMEDNENGDGHHNHGVVWMPNNMVCQSVYTFPLMLTLCFSPFLGICPVMLLEPHKKCGPHSSSSISFQLRLLHMQNIFFVFLSATTS